MTKVDVPQILISFSAIFGIGLIWYDFNVKVFKTVRRVAAAPFSWPKKEADSSIDCSNEEGYWSDDCSEARTQIPEHPPFYISWSDEEESDWSDDSSEERTQMPEHPPFYIS